MKKMSPVLIVLALAFLLFTPVVLFSAGRPEVSTAAQVEFPTKPVSVVIPFGAGGGSDVFVRAMQQSIGANDLMPQPLVILNVPGGGSVIGSRRVLNANPDGYEILFNHIALLASQAGGRIDFGWNNFEPIAATGMIAPVLMVREDAPWASLEDFIQYAKENPEEINFGVNMGGLNHTAGLVLADAAGVKFNFVQIGGGADTFVAIRGGHVHAGAFTGAEIVNFSQQGLRPLATFSPERDPNHPNLPSMEELGYDASLVTYQMWFAPKGTPAERVDYLADVLEAVVATQSAQDHFVQIKMDPGFMRGEELISYLTDAYSVLESVMPKLAE